MGGSEVSKSEVKCSWVKRSESLSNRMSNIIRGYIDHMKFAAFMVFFFYHIPSCSFGSFLSLFIWLYVLYTFVNFCKLCILIVMFMYSYCYVYSVLFG